MTKQEMLAPVNVKQSQDLRETLILAKGAASPALIATESMACGTIDT